MNIKEFLTAYNSKNNWGTNDRNLFQTLEDGEIVYSEQIGTRRWWDEYFYVTKINDVFIGWYGVRSTSDNSPEDLGWEPDVFADIFEVEEIEETVTIKKYVKK